MSKPIIPPAKPSGAPGESEETLREIGRVLGATPNIYRTAAHSPAALQSLWFQVGAASHMSLTARLREIIALRVAQFNGCSYSLAAHTSMAVEFGIDSEQALQYRRGVATDPKEQVVLDLISKVVENRGHHTGFEVQAARAAGISDAEIVEVIALVGLYTFTNYLDCVADSDVDYPPADDLAPASKGLPSHPPPGKKSDCH